MKFGEIFERIWRNFDCVYPATLLKKQKELEKAKWRPDSSAPDDPAAPVARLHQVPRESRTSALTPGVSSPLPLPPSPLGLFGVGHSPGGRRAQNRSLSAVQCGRVCSVECGPRTRPKEGVRKNSRTGIWRTLGGDQTGRQFGRILTQEDPILSAQEDPLREALLESAR